MTIPAVGDAVPDIEVPATGNRMLRLSAFRGRKLVLFFYPKASTPGCTLEGQGFRDAEAAFAAAGAVVLGASRDTLKAQENFKAKQAFPFDLLADKEEQLCNAFGVIKQKKMYGKDVRGIERSTFLIDEAGVLRREWRGVKVPGHVDAVLQAVQALNQGDE